MTYLSLFAVVISMLIFVLFKSNSLTVIADHCEPEYCPTGAHVDYKCDTGEYTGCPPCSGCGGGAIPPGADAPFYDIPKSTPSAATNIPAPIGACWTADPKSRIVPITWHWPAFKNVHLQVYDSTGAWWFNGWIRSNSFTVFSKDGKGQYPGIPADGRTVFAKVNYGGNFASVGKINCSLR